MYTTISSFVVVLLAASVQCDSVVDVAKANGCASIVGIIDKAGLTSALNSAKNLTFFAPSDEAVKAVPQAVLDMLTANATYLQDVLKYHVIGAEAAAATLKNDMLLPTLFTGSNLRVNIYNKKSGNVVTAEGSVVSKPDLKAANGIVHVIDKVIFPIPVYSSPVYININKDINNLGYLALKANILNNLLVQNLTIFAPSNEAIKKIPGQKYNDLLSNKTELLDVLEFHVVNTTVYSAGIDKHTQLTTLSGKTLTVHLKDDGVHVEGAKVTTADISTTNGVIHIMDKILFPPKYGDYFLTDDRDLHHLG